MGSGRKANKKILTIGSIICLILIFAAGLVRRNKTEHDYAQQLALVVDDSDIAAEIREGHPQAVNTYTKLWVPTMAKKIGDLWFIVDSYHNQILYAGGDKLGTPLNEWQTLPGEFKGPHTISGDGEVFIVDDTENNRIETFVRQDVEGAETVGSAEAAATESAVDPGAEKDGNTPAQFALGQVFTNVGIRPHCTYYDEDNQIFYVWSSQTGDMYIFKRKDSSTDLEILGIRPFEEMKNTYVRSFTIADNSMWFVSGVSMDAINGKAEKKGSSLIKGKSAYSPRILQYSMPDLKLVGEYPVPDEVAGMVQMVPDAVLDSAQGPNSAPGDGSAQNQGSAPGDGDAQGQGSTQGLDSPQSHGWLISVSTDRAGSQDAAGLIHVKDLDQFATTYEDAWTHAIPGGGAPYFITESEGKYYTVSGDNKEHTLWQFEMNDGTIADPVGMY